MNQSSRIAIAGRFAFYVAVPPLLLGVAFGVFAWTLKVLGIIGVNG